MIPASLLELLRCPESHQKLRPAPPDLLQKLNLEIAARRVRNRAGKTVEQPLDGGLLREDATLLYPIRGNLPIMLIDEALAIPPQP